MLGDDALAFLVGFCVQSFEQSAEPLHTNIALKHAGAFLMARLGDDKSVDYQTVVPPLLIVMRGADKSGRQAVLECFALLTQLAEKKFTSVYCMDTLYGDRSGEQLVRLPSMMLSETCWVRLSAVFGTR